MAQPERRTGSRSRLMRAVFRTLVVLLLLVMLLRVLLRQQG
jgi:hypothetical protein